MSFTGTNSNDFPFDILKYQKILDDIAKSKSLNRANIKNKNTRGKSVEVNKDKKLKYIDDYNKNKNFKQRLREKKMNYNPPFNLRRNREMNINSKSSFDINTHTLKSSKNISLSVSKEKRISQVIKGIHCNRSKSKPKVLHINIKEMMKEIILESTKEETDIEKIDSHAKVNNVSNNKDEYKEEVKHKSTSKSTSNPKPIKEKVDEILNYSFDTRRKREVSFSEQDSLSKITKRNRRSKSNENKKSGMEADMYNSNSSIDKFVRSHSLSCSKSTPNMNIYKHSGMTPNQLTNRNFSVNHISKFYLNSSDFDFKKVYRPRIKFSYLWDLVNMCERRKQILAEKRREELSPGSLKSPGSPSNPGSPGSPGSPVISASKSKSNSKSRRDKINKSQTTRRQNIKVGEKNIYISPEEKKKHHKHHMHKNEFNDKTYLKYKNKDSHYLTNYYISRKNKMLEEILNKNYKGNKKNSIDEGVYRKNIEWLNFVNENKVKFEKKLKEDLKITDETERLFKGFPRSIEREEEMEVSSLASEGFISSINYKDSNNNNIYVNYDELIKDLTKKLNIAANSGFKPTKKKITEVKIENVGIGKNKMQIFNPMNVPTPEEDQVILMAPNNQNYLETIKSEQESLCVNSNVPYVRKSVTSHKSSNRLNDKPAFTERTYNQRLKELINNTNNSKNIETIILEKKKKFNLEDEEVLNKSKKMLEKYKSGFSSNMSSTPNLINMSENGEITHTE